ncbi:MAG TPA: hypothetical protein VNG51_08000 [Ktedonobacteraceae bacterium]|nr:hypothetical protein [Ktedonobacteraceae bacterium]
MQKAAKYISSKEGERLLGVKRNTFFYYVKSGQIAKKERAETDKGTNLYSYADTLKVKEIRDRKKKKLSTMVDWQKISDLPAIIKLDLAVYKENIVGDIGLYVSWEKKNPKITLLAFESNNRENVLAYVSLVPLPEQVILSILKGEREELSISPDEVETYDRRGGYTLLAESAVAHPDHPEQLSNVIREVLNFWCDQYPDRYIEKIYAQAASDAGDILVRKLYFSPLYNLSDNAYVLDLRKPGASKLVRHFQQCLKTKESQMQSERTKVS